MSQNQSAAQTQHRLKARLKSLTARPALTALVAAGMLAGSAGTAVIATSSSATPAGTAAFLPSQGCTPTQGPSIFCGSAGYWNQQGGLDGAPPPQNTTTSPTNPLFRET